jgi:hypothetical protein
MYSRRDTLTGRTDRREVFKMSDDVGRAARLVIDQLVAHGFGVQTREWEELWNLTVVGVEQARACLTVADEDLYLRWDYQPHTGPRSSPAALAAIVLHIFGADARNLPDDGTAYRNFLLKGAVGRILEDQGLKVELLTYEDMESFDVVAEISVTCPARPELGPVRVTDHGDVEWECHAGEAFGGDPGRIVPVVASVLRRAVAERAAP